MDGNFNRNKEYETEWLQGGNKKVFEVVVTGQR